ncbi:MAG: methionyl-tRNA formyltransferase [bacterium]|nr:methionyl-tRNA formyltransferase [bacterium]
MSMRIIFLGTSAFAVPSLAAIIQSNQHVISVITQPDRPYGRGLKLHPSPVKQFAQQHQLPVETPESIKSETFINHIMELHPEIIVVVAYGKILPPTLLQIPKYGCVNVHGSLLPKYRGAAPIQWALIRGETETGVTTMFMNENMDEGDIIFQEKIPILPEDNAGSLSVKLAQLGGSLLQKTLNAIEMGIAPRIPQNHQEATYAPKLTNTDGRIDWNKPAGEIVNLIRGVTPSPGAFTFLKGKRLRIHLAKVGLGSPAEPAGKIILVGKHDESGIVVQTGNNTAVQILRVQPENGKIMSAAQFARGYRLTEGSYLGV